jgi:serine/threonine-protein kinase ULK/ATG1
MERCFGGDLSKYMKSQKNKLQEHVAHKFLCDLAYGLKVLNTMNLVHRDLKPANLMLSNVSSDHNLGSLKIADFGFAREIKPEEYVVVFV